MTDLPALRELVAFGVAIGGKLAVELLDEVEQSRELRDQLREAVEAVDAASIREARLTADLKGTRQRWENSNHHHVTEVVRLEAEHAEAVRASLAAVLAENSDLRALLLEARSRNPEHYRSSPDDSGTRGAETVGELLPPSSPDWTRVAPSGEGSGQPIIRKGWCPHCGVIRIEDFS